MLCAIYNRSSPARQNSAWPEGRCLQEPSAPVACVLAQQARAHTPAVQNVHGLPAVGEMGAIHWELLAEDCWTGTVFPYAYLLVKVSLVAFPAMN